MTLMPMLTLVGLIKIKMMMGVSVVVIFSFFYSVLLFLFFEFVLCNHRRRGLDNMTR